MLKLKRVEIQGFKSFFDRTEMKFNGSGIAAVVGPNGCGKSNLSDAISWVLGEQSAKILRGTRMEDVIFAGTRDRKPLGLGFRHHDAGGSVRRIIPGTIYIMKRTATPTATVTQITSRAKSPSRAACFAPAKANT